jgi:hypothetical protein
MLVKPVADKYFMTDAELEDVQKIGHEKSMQKEASVSTQTGQGAVMIKLAWVAVLIPIAYGVWSTIQKAWALFS